MAREHHRGHLRRHLGVAKPRARVLGRVRAHEQAHDVARARVAARRSVMRLCAHERARDAVDHAQCAPVARVLARGEVADVVEQRRGEVRPEGLEELVQRAGVQLGVGAGERVRLSRI